MPNWMSNSVTIEAKNVEEIVKFLESPDGNNPFDLNQIIPMPESLKITSGSSNKPAVCVYLSEGFRKDPIKDEETSNLLKQLIYILNPFNKFPDDYYDIKMSYESEIMDYVHKGGKLEEHPLMIEGKQLVENFKNYGACTWYEWSYQNWDTKWNTYEHSEFTYYDDGSAGIQFFTAWSPPMNALCELSKKFPDATIRNFYSDEDIFGAVGEITFKNGEYVLYERPLEGTDDVVEYCKHVCGKTPEECGYTLDKNNVWQYDPYQDYEFEDEEE